MLKFEGPAPPKDRNIVSRKMQFGLVQTHIQVSVVSGPKFTGLLSLNAGGIAGDHLLFRFSICGSVPEIFAIEVNSFLKSRRILDVFALPNSPKFVPTLTPRPRGTSQSYRRANPEFSAQFYMFALKFFGVGPPSPLGVSASKPWSICSAC